LTQRTSLTKPLQQNKPDGADTPSLIMTKKFIKDLEPLQPVPVKELPLLAQEPSSFVSKDHFAITRSIQFETLTLKDASSMHASGQDDTAYSKASCIKIICSIFGIYDLNFNVVRNVFLLNARELIVRKFEGNVIVINLGSRHKYNPH
jgi:hypothetical protein